MPSELQCSNVLRVNPQVPQFAGVILVTPDNGIILQLRDDNPQIVDPGCLSIFAGKGLASETPIQTALREIKDETLLRFTAAELANLCTYTKDRKRYGRVAQSHIFVARDVDSASLDVQEGQGYRIIHGPADLENQPFALISKEILEYYFANQN